MKQPLLRDKEAGILSGLCQGLGEYFHKSPWLFRALFVVPALPFILNTASTVLSIVTYIALSLIIKDKSAVPAKTVRGDYEIVEDQEKEEMKGEDHDHENDFDQRQS